MDNGFIFIMVQVSRPERMDAACFMCIGDFQVLMKAGGKQVLPQITISGKQHLKSLASIYPNDAL